jgi:L-alanine-DL-glutamate epimerase-like enolase superfamily enzyme
VRKIVEVDVWRIDLPPPVPRSDAIQSFVVQETPMVRITCDDGSQGVGYSYTIGTGGSSVVALLRDHLAPRLIGRDAAFIEAIWRDLLFATHATSVGAITSLALAAIDTALWDWRCKRDGQPLWKAAGGAKQRTPVYTTEGGWLHLSTDTIVRETVAAKEAGFQGAKIKVGLSRVADDVARLRAVRQAVGDGFEIMVDASRSAKRCAARRRTPTSASPGSKSRCRPTRSSATRAWPPRRRCLSPSASRCSRRRSSRPTSNRAPVRSFRRTSRASAASRRG